MQTPLYRHLFRYAVLALIAVSSLPAASAAPNIVRDVPWLPMEGTRMSYLPEPMFGGQIAIYEAGMHNARQVLLVHGLGQEASRIWASTFTALAHDFHVIAFDLPGFGDSAKGNHAYEPAAYAQVLKLVADATTEAPFMLVGHSMGGAVSLSYAAQYPDSVSRLLLVDVAGILHRSVYAGYLSRLGLGFLPDVLPGQKNLLSALAQTALGAIVDPLVPSRQVFNSPLLRTKLLAGDPNRIAALGLALQDYGDILPAVTSPTLVLWGQDDPVAPLRTGRLLAGALHPARLRVIPGGGHSPMLEAEAAFNKLLHGELSRTDKVFSDMNYAQAYGLPRQLLSSKHDVACEASDEELVLEGHYRNVRINGCDNVRIRNAHLSALHVEDARVVMENSHIIGLGLRCNDSRVEVTGGSISGIHAIDCEDSELDLAGVTVKGEQSALRGNDTLVYLSVSRLLSPRGASRVHQLLFLDGEQY